VTPVAYSLFDDASRLKLFGRRRAVPESATTVVMPAHAMRATQR